MSLGTGITECPQAGMNTEPKPLDRRAIDEVERLSNKGDDRRTNTEYSCFPQDELTIDSNPVNLQNLVGGANDYRNGVGSSGFFASTDGGQTWYDNIIPFPSGPANAATSSSGIIPSGGDPAVVFDRAGIAYYAQLAGQLNNDDNGVFVARSTNGGFTWSRACVAIDTTPTNTTDDAARCGSVGDPRRPGDGTVVYQNDNNSVEDFSVTFNDKEYIAAGPRPAGVTPRCFTPVTRTPTPCDPALVGVDRLYVTWSSFNNPMGLPFFITSSTIELSYSDDQGRSWSPRRTISGSAPFCAFAFAGGNECDDNQFSVPTVNPTNGLLGVIFENFNTPDENQYLFVRSSDGGQTTQGPFFVTPVFDVNFPRAGPAGGRPDCSARGQARGRIVYTNSCFRSNAGGNVVADRRGGAFGDDFYMVFSDNRNGTRASSNADVFTFKSVDGGTTWIGPTRVNDDPSNLGTADRDTFTAGNFGNDQWWPWVDIGMKGDLNVMFKDRRLDTSSVRHEWPTSRQRPGNYLVWTWAAQCRVSSSTAAPGQQCVASGAAAVPQPTAPIDPSSGPLPGQGSAFLGQFRNFQVSDVPSNFDYSFRAGIFAGDYDVIAVGRRGTNDDDEGDEGSEVAYAHFTDARNGRSSGGPGGGPPSTFPSQPGRNPLCEQSDSFFDVFSAKNGGKGGSAGNLDPFLVTLCPADSKDPGSKGDDD